MIRTIQDVQPLMRPTLSVAVSTPSVEVYMQWSGQVMRLKFGTGRRQMYQLTLLVAPQCHQAGRNLLSAPREELERLMITFATTALLSTPISVEYGQNRMSSGQTLVARHQLDMLHAKNMSRTSRQISPTATGPSTASRCTKTHLL